MSLLTLRKNISHIHKGALHTLPGASAPGERRKMIETIRAVIAGIIALVLSTSVAESRPAYTQEDINLLAEVIYHENWHTDKEHLAAYYTGAVVMNRVKSSEWPNSIRGVLYQKGQYSTTKYFYTVTLPEECYEMAESILKNGTPDVPDNIIWQAMKPQGKGTWKKVGTDYFCY